MGRVVARQGAVPGHLRRLPGHLVARAGAGRGRHVAYSSWDGMYSLDSHWLAAMAFMAPLAYLNARGSRLVGDTSVGLLIVLLVPLVVLVILGFHHWLTTPGVEPLQPFTAGGLSPRQAAGAALAIVMWNYVSFDAVSTRVVRSTTRDVPIRLPCSSAFLSSW
jgi:amino acid transporter